MPTADTTTHSSPPALEARTRQLLDWLPLGLMTGAFVAVLRLLGRQAASARELAQVTDVERELIAWEGAYSFLPELVPALILSILAASLIHQAALAQQSSLQNPDDAQEATTQSSAPLFLLGALCLLSACSGWPAAPEALRALTHGELAVDDLFSCAAASFGAAMLLFLAARLQLRGFSLRPVYSGYFGLGISISALLYPLLKMRGDAQDAPHFIERTTAVDLLADQRNFKVLEENAAAPPSIGILTPAVENSTDSADKPAFIMPPPCRVSFVVGDAEGPLVLRAAAGLDKTIRHWMETKKRTRCSVEYLVRVDGEVVFQQSIASQATWDPAKIEEGAFVWHHVGGEQGLELEPGAVVELETRIPIGDPAEAFPAKVLKAGFGTLVLERRREVARTTARPTAPNLILIVMDTLRADRMSCYGYERPTTPHLDDLASEGLLFENAMSTASWTWPSTASILTGLGADAHGVISNESCTLNFDLTSVAEVLQQRGFTTAAFSCNKLIAADRNFDQGFELFDHDKQNFRMSDEVMPDILRWVRGHRGARFFLYLHLADPHTPHRPHPEELERLGVTAPADFPDRGMDRYTLTLAQLARKAETTAEDLDAAVPPEHKRWIHDQYDASVATGDRWLGVLFQELERLNLRENTIIAFTSDHGEELFDHALLEHGHTVYSELVHVPLILAGPGIPRGQRVEQVVSNRHLGPTLARLGGAEMPRMEGDPLDFLLADELSDQALFQTVKGLWNGASRQRLFGVREGPWVLHWREDEQLGHDDVRLFNAEADPGETHEVSMQEVELATGMQARLEESVKAQRSFTPLHQVGAGASTMNELHGMGYAGRDDEVEEVEVDDDDDGR